MTTDSVARLHQPSPADVDRCIRQHRPVIFTGLMADMAAARWDLPTLTARLGDRPVAVVRQLVPLINWDPQHGLPLQQMTFREFVRQTFERPQPGFSYLQEDLNSVPVLGRDLQLPQMFRDRPIERTKLWLSGSGLITPLHYDPVETFHWMIRGDKRFLCYPPGTARFYPHPVTTTAPFISRVDPDNLDSGRFPRFRPDEACEIALRAGEVLYLPSFWWHQVYSRAELNISLNFVWLVSRLRSARHLVQFLRSRRHLARALGAARSKAAAAAAEQA
jgi:hypothetical protein